MKRQPAGLAKHTPWHVAARVAIVAAALHAIALTGGMVVSLPDRWLDHATALAGLRLWDSAAVEWASAHYEPALAPGLYAALGPAGVLYVVLTVLTVFSALLFHWRKVAPATLSLLLATGIAVEVQWLTTTILPHPHPLTVPAELPADPYWQALWMGSEPSAGRHVAITAALAGTLASTWLLMALPAHTLASLAAAAAVYSGAARPSDAVLEYVIGLMAASGARFLVSWALPAALGLMPQWQRRNRTEVRAPVVLLNARHAASSIGGASGGARAA